MRIRDILARDCVLSDLKSTNKTAVIAELSDCLKRTNPSLSKEQVERVLLERERLGSTGIGNGVAIPHGKLEGLDHIVAAFGRSREGISFDAQDGKDSHLFFILLAPENAAGLHLKALARLSRLLKDSYFRDKLIEASSQDELYEAIIHEDEKS